MNHNRGIRIFPGKRLNIRLRLHNESDNSTRLINIPIRVIGYDRANKKMSAICKSNEILERTYVEVADFLEPNNITHWQQRAIIMDWATYDIRGTRITIHRPIEGMITDSQSDSELTIDSHGHQQRRRRRNIGLHLREQAYQAILIRHGVSLAQTNTRR